MTCTQPKRRFRFRPTRFRLSTLLLLVAICAAAFAFVGRDLIRSRIERGVIEKIERAGGKVLYDYQEIDSASPEWTPPGPQFARSLFGDDLYATATLVYLPNLKIDDVQLIRELTGLEDVRLAGPRINDECIDALLRLPKLRALSLRETSISPAGLKRLESVQTLESLVLSDGVLPDGTVSDDHLAALVDFPRLQAISLHYALVSDDGIQSIGRTTTLKELYFRRCSNVTGAGIQGLSGLTEMESLRMRYCPISDASLGAISRMKRLRVLQVQGPITDVGFSQMPIMFEMEELNLHSTDVGDESLKLIGQFTRLKSLNLYRTKISDAGLPSLNSLKDLSTLSLSGTGVTDDGLAALGGLSSLTKLSVDIGGGVTFDGVDALKELLPNCEINCWKRRPDGGSGAWLKTR